MTVLVYSSLHYVVERYEWCHTAHLWFQQWGLTESLTKPFLYFVGAVLRQTSMGYRREYTLIHLTVVGCAAFFMGVVICVGIYICFHNWKSIRSYDVQKPANGSVYDKPRFGSFASQLSLDFLTVNNKVYDSCTLSSRSTAVVKDNTFRKDKYKNFPENMYATIRTNYSLRTEV